MISLTKECAMAGRIREIERFTDKAEQLLREAIGNDEVISRHEGSYTEEDGNYGFYVGIMRATDGVKYCLTGPFGGNVENICSFEDHGIYEEGDEFKYIDWSD
jgi:hypothetical protein